ncbi:type VI secretion system Vgr family protein, partial [Pseudoduganella buxea]
EMTVTLLQPDGSRRAWHGLCTEAAWLGANGGVARYRLRLEPALALLRLRRDSYIFQDKTVQDIVTELLSDYPQLRFEFDISQDQPTRTICTQYRESDLEFFTRLLASEGLNWRFEHDQPQGEDPDSPDGQARHKLERIASGFDNGAAADPHSRLMLQALELDNKLFEGAGAVRRLAPGHAFTLTQHERYGPGSDAFVALWVEHEARNNFQAQIKTAANADLVENGTYRNRFGCVRDAVAIVPRAAAAAHPVTALGPQTAIVVGLADAVAHTGRDHQVRIQFAWQRGEGANAGGMAHNTDETGNAPGDERSGTWVRVAEALAGPNWGSQFTPRIGTEVLVDFIEGDMDRPVVVAQLYTGADLPPFSAGVDSGANHPGTLSGIHSHNFSGDGYNQWQLDDTQGQVRMRLATSSAATQLNLGYLIQQSPTSSQRGAYRGAGFELRTDAWAIVRGGEGVLLTTSARSAQGASVTSTQMDASEALAGFKAAEELAQTISDAATAQNALVSKNAATAHKDFVALLDPEQKGKFSGAVNGQGASKAHSGSRELDASQPVEKFGAPIVVLDSPTSINWATPASTVLFAGQQLRWITQGDVQMTAAHTVSSVAANAASFFTHSGGIQAIAANGPVSLQAHTDQLEIVAEKSVTVISVNDSIEIKANQKIVLQAGQSSITLEGGDITFACPGNFTVKGGKHVFDGGVSAAVDLPLLPDDKLPLNTLYLDHRYHDDQPLAGAEYVVTLADGTERKGKLDSQGRAAIPDVPGGSATVSYGPMPGAFERVDLTPMPNYDPAPSEAKIESLVDKYLKTGTSVMTPVSVDKEQV